jgi:hypothetical protein
MRFSLKIRIKEINYLSLFMSMRQIVTLIHGKKIGKNLRVNIQVCIFDHRITH